MYKNVFSPKFNKNSSKKIDWHYQKQDMKLKETLLNYISNKRFFSVLQRKDWASFLYKKTIIKLLIVSRGDQKSLLQFQKQEKSSEESGNWF